MTLEENSPPDGEPGAPVERALPRHRAALIRRIRTLMEFWSITEDELQRVRPRRAVVQAPAEIKYRHPVSGDTWDGQGPQPDWLRRALLREGFTVEELRQAAQVTPEPQLDTPPLDPA